MDAQVKFWTSVDVKGPDDCWNWLASRSTNGYGNFRIPNGRSTQAHRYSYFISNGEIPSKMVVMHRCDNPSCVNPAHLKLGTQSENIKEAFSKGRATPSNQKLSKTDVGEIKKLYSTGEYSQRKLARMFGCHQSNISLLLRK